MVGIGLVGIGFLGMIHHLADRRVAGAQVVAVCSRDPAQRAGDWTGIHGNFGPRGTHRDLSGVETYREFPSLLSDPNVRLVDLCVPSDTHARMAIQALEAGKHVLVEQPIALSRDDADRMIAAAEATGRCLMVAHVLPFVPEFAHALEVVRSGQFGVIRPDGTIQHPELGSADPVDAFAHELTAAVEAVTHGTPPPELSAERARQALAICRAEVRSVPTGTTQEVR